MVFLTLSRWIRSRGPDRYWKVQELLKHARVRQTGDTGETGETGRPGRALSAAARFSATLQTAAWLITAVQSCCGSLSPCSALTQHGLKYPVLIHYLLKSQVSLNRKVLAELAVSEPHTFCSLAQLAAARRGEGLAAALGEGKEPEGVFSRVVQSQ
ncbi:39S ribosomal protein L20, mitochondrial [Polyodon spathula]|uniref:39S ribosomal protein L20, mitochondrial n=1 Tax=Polyodon spathula TaxID=7913 RepID=UPI001B7EEB4F|nr:39S ribosomal protein L20, mitochondrial [Polyodon spathula]